MLPKVTRNLASMVGGRDTDADVPKDKYVPVLQNVLSNALMLEGWLAHYEQRVFSVETGAILDYLRKCGQFFLSVFCAFLVRDLGLLLDHYLRDPTAAFAAHS